MSRDRKGSSILCVGRYVGDSKVKRFKPRLADHPAWQGEAICTVDLERDSYHGGVIRNHPRPREDDKILLAVFVLEIGEHTSLSTD